VNLSRRTVTRLNHVLDEWVPPRLRDSRAAAWAARRMYGQGTPIGIDELKDRAFGMSRAEYAEFYKALDSRFDLGETDLTPESEAATVAAVVGHSVLDVACGKGHLTRRLRAAGHAVVGCDVALHTGDRALAGAGGDGLVEGLVEELPFGDATFDRGLHPHP
jgi:2-polyprenyl-3-methyl-5-hydroxy-6-metoxy-1,4-benzoquinol methylase